MTTTWYWGPPPHVGWWLARDPAGFRHEWRWWNGDHWSVAVAERYPASEAGGAASLKSSFSNVEITWSLYWPQNARVPRLDPTAGDWTFTNWKPPAARTVEVVFRNANTMVVDSWLVSWENRGIPGDILAWRRPPSRSWP